MLRLFLIPALGILLVGCHRADLGTGINKVTRDYARSAEDTYDGALSACKSLDLRVDVDQHDKMGGKIVARRGDQSKVEITVEQVDAAMSRVSIYIEPGNTDQANDLHERIADKLGLSPSGGGLFGGSSVSGRYPIDLETGMASARGAYKALDFQITGESRSQNTAQVDGRMKDSRPLRIKMDLTSDGLEVTFVAGTSKNDDNRSFATSLKVEFERGIAP